MYKLSHNLMDIEREKYLVPNNEEHAKVMHLNIEYLKPGVMGSC